MVKSMHAAEARNLIYQALERLLEPVGFVIKKSEEAFVRRFAGGRSIIGIPFWSYPPQHVFSLLPAVRIDKIEEMYCEINDTPSRIRGTTMTLVVKLWKLSGMEKPLRDVPLPDFGCPFYYTVSSTQAISEVVNSIEPVVRDMILPFFDRHQDIHCVNRALNHEGLDTGDGRFLHDLIAAYLAKEPTYGDIVSRYRDEMATWQPSDRELFDRAVDYLAARPV